MIGSFIIHRPGLLKSSLNNWPTLMHGLCLVYWNCLDKLHITFYLSHYQIQGGQIQHKMPYVIPAHRRLSADSCQNRAVLLTLLCVASLWASCLLDLKTGETDSKKRHVSHLCPPPLWNRNVLHVHFHENLVSISIYSCRCHYTTVYSRIQIKIKCTCTQLHHIHVAFWSVGWGCLIDKPGFFFGFMG